MYRDDSDPYQDDGRMERHEHHRDEAVQEVERGVLGDALGRLRQATGDMEESIRKAMVVQADLLARLDEVAIDGAGRVAEIAALKAEVARLRESVASLLRCLDRESGKMEAGIALMQRAGEHVTDALLLRAINQWLDDDFEVQELVPFVKAVKSDPEDDELARLRAEVRVLERALEILGEIGKACPFAWAGQLDECFFEHGAPDEGCPPYNGCARRYAIERARDYVEQSRKEGEE